MRGRPLSNAGGGATGEHKTTTNPSVKIGRTKSSEATEKNKSGTMASKPSILRFKFDDFENLPFEPENYTDSERVTDDSGNHWLLRIHGGASGDNVGRKIGLSLYRDENDGEGEVTAKIAFILRDAVGGVYRYVSGDDIDVYAPGEAVGWGNILKRSKILDKENNILLDGALIVDFDIQIVKGRKEYQPSNPVAKNMLKFYESADDTDVTFKVGDTTFPAHKLILQINAPILHNFCARHGEGMPLAIKDTTPEVFRLMLRYIYGADASETIGLLNVGRINPVGAAERRTKLGKDIIEAANRYGIIGLKLAVETALVERCVITIDNVVDWILFADAKTCPLLKEYATNYFVAHATDVLNSDSSKKLKESPQLLSELLLASNSPKNDCFEQTRRMSVDQLRKALNEKGLDVDGSKEMLVSRLDESNANKRQRTE